MIIQRTLRYTKLSQNNVRCDGHVLSVRALKMTCDALITLQAAVSISFVAFCLVSAGTDLRKAFWEEWSQWPSEPISVH